MVKTVAGVSKVDHQFLLGDSRKIFHEGLACVRLVEDGTMTGLIRDLGSLLLLPDMARPSTGLPTVVWLTVAGDALSEEGRERFRSTCESLAGEVESVRSGCGILVFDMSSEGHAFDPFGPPLANFLHEMIEKLQVSADQAVWIQSNPLFPHDYVRYAAKIGKIPMQTLVANNWVPLMLALSFETHHPAQRKSYGFGFALQQSGQRKNRYACLNYLLRGHRILLAAKLRRLAVVGHLTISTLRKTHYRKPLEVLFDEVKRLSEPSASTENLLLAESLLEEQIDFCGDLPDGTPFEERIFSLPVDELSRSELFIVTESEMLDAGNSRFTEKTLKALVSGLPFIVFGNKGAVQQLRSIGFDVFDDFVDHSYDSASDPARRFTLAWASIVSYLDRSPGFTEAELFRLRNASEANRLVFSSRLLSQYALDPVLSVLRAAGMKPLTIT
jgi:hypothetical protein